MKNIDLKSLRNKLNVFFRLVKKHLSFIALLAVLLAYIMVVAQISRLAGAEPSADAKADASANIPKIDPAAVNQIQALEQNNTQVHSLFNQARNNPFQE